MGRLRHPTGRGRGRLGNYAYVADYRGGLQIDEMSPIPAPSWAGCYNTPDYARGVAVMGDYAYVADGYSGLQIVDITNPAAPFGRFYNTPATPMAWSSSAATPMWRAGLIYRSWTFSNPAAPSLSGSYNTLLHARDVFVLGNYAYVADDWSGLQDAWNVPNPAAPFLTGGYDTPAMPMTFSWWATTPMWADRYSGLQIVNVSNPAAPFLAGSYNTPGSATDVFVLGDYVYVANGDGLQIVNVSNPAAPFLSGKLRHADWALDVFVLGNYAYVTDGYSGLQIVNVSNPAAPIIRQLQHAGPCLGRFSGGRIHSHS